MSVHDELKELTQTAKYLVENAEIQQANIEIIARTLQIHERRWEEQRVWQKQIENEIKAMRSDFQQLLNTYLQDRKSK
jgi:fructose-specific phosphotransferase system component IIB